MTGEPDGIKRIFAADPDIFSVPSADFAGPLLGQGSLILMTGQRHRQARQILAPPFHGDRVRAHGEAVREIAERHIQGWRSGVPFVAQDAAQAISLDVIVRSVFGVSDRHRAEELADALIDVMTRARSALLYFKPMRRQLFGLSGWARLQRAIARTDGLIHAHIERRRQVPDHSGDILGLLLDARCADGAPMTRGELRDQLMTLLLAGYDAPAVTVAWALYCLHEHPEVLEALRAELTSLGQNPSPGDIVGAPYLDAVLRETMRLYPILGSVIRRLEQPLELAGYTLPAGTIVGAATTIAHRRSERFPEPERFEPGRFVGESYSPFEYLPFGGGARRCIGAAFALYEMKIILATIVMRAVLRLLPKQDVAPRTRGVAVVPNSGVRMIRVG